MNLGNFWSQKTRDLEQEDLEESRDKTFMGTESFIRAYNNKHSVLITQLGHLYSKKESTFSH